MLAGGKVVKIDRVEWLAIPDPMTAVNALLQGEIDLIEAPVPDHFSTLKKDAFGGHRSKSRGRGGDPTDELKTYEFGDQFHVFPVAHRSSLAMLSKQARSTP